MLSPLSVLYNMPFNRYITATVLEVDCLYIANSYSDFPLMD